MRSGWEDVAMRHMTGMTKHASQTCIAMPVWIDCNGGTREGGSHCNGIAPREDGPGIITQISGFLTCIVILATWIVEGGRDASH
jgi:hypothetical protein